DSRSRESGGCALSAHAHAPGFCTLVHSPAGRQKSRGAGGCADAIPALSLGNFQEQIEGSPPALASLPRTPRTGTFQGFPLLSFLCVECVPKASPLPGRSSRVIERR